MSFGPKTIGTGEPGGGEFDGSALFALLSPLANNLECGVMLVDARDRIVFTSRPFTSICGIEQEQMIGMTPMGLTEHMATLVDDPPPVLKERRIFPRNNSIVLEEIVLLRPTRMVLRWVARRLAVPFPCTMVVATDITAEVDLTIAYERMAVTDRLTGLTNRRGVEQILRRELSGAGRYGLPLSLVLLDVDHFKLVNDQHGHDVGDQVLRGVGRTLARQLRDSDTAARWGGEEFLLVLPSTGAEAGMICAERVRKAVGASPSPTGAPVTISGGLVQYAAGETLEQVLGRADKNLYEAKHRGRDRIVAS